MQRRDIINRTVIRHPTSKARKRLGHWERREKLAWYWRGRTVLLADDHKIDTTVVTQVADVNSNTIRFWLHTFDPVGAEAKTSEIRR